MPRLCCSPNGNFETVFLEDWVDVFGDGSFLFIDESTGDLYPTPIGDGSVWQPYTFDMTLPTGTDGIKVVLLWGQGSVIGFDNVEVDDTPIPAPTSIPNGNFEIAEGDSWGNNSDGGTFNITFPVGPGGNPGGYARIEDATSSGGFAVLVSYSDATMPLTELGLNPGQSYKFSQDMKILSGSNIGGLKVEFYNLGNKVSDTGDLFRPVITPGTEWQTYNYDISIPLAADGIKVVCIWGNASVVGFDNITFSTTPVVVPPISNADFELGGAGWAFYQANTSASFPATDGNPNGHARMVNTGGGYGVLVANGNTIIPLTTLGISVGETVTFKQDMKLFSGSNIGRFKVEYYNSAGAKLSELEKITPKIGDGSTWETYTYDFVIPAGTAGIKIVLVAGIGSNVGYDNIGIVAPPGEDFASWISGFPEVGSLTGFHDDADHDGIANGLENFFGTHPGVFSKGLMVAAVTNNTFVFTHPQNASPASDVSDPAYRWSTDLQTFHADGASNGAGTTTVSFSVQTNIPSTGTTTVTATITGAVIPKKLFVKVGVSQNP